jgi:competence protein ComEC
VLIAPSGDQAALRDDDGRLTILGKRFNAFAVEQWLSADADGREATQARDPDPACDRFGCVGALPEGESLALVEDRMGFEEDCARAKIVVSPLTAPIGCKAAEVFDERRLAKTGAVGLVWNGGRVAMTTDRGVLEDRPWSPAPKRPRSDRVGRPGDGGSMRTDPADPIVERP